MTNLINWGYDACFQAVATDAELPARVLSSSHGIYELMTEAGLQTGELAGSLEYAAASPLDLPVAGDWVMATATEPALILRVLPRRSLFARSTEKGRQPMAANIDVAFLVTSLDADFSVPRLDRYLLLARDAGVRPVIVLNKADLHPEFSAASLPGEAVCLSALHDDVETLLSPYVPSGQTAALFGSSGVGKSTIVNRLLGTAAQTTAAVRQEDAKGRHTTTNRRLFRLPCGWLLMDLPGLRAVGVIASPDALLESFADIAALAAQCRFRDCSHSSEPGCAVVGAVPPTRLESYAKLAREAAYQLEKEDAAAARARKEHYKRLTRVTRKLDKRG